MVRKANKKDEKQIISLGRMLNPDYSQLFDLKKILKKDYNRFYVYEVDGKIVGFLHATVLYENTEIINLIVEPTYRKQKIASNLFDTLLTELPLDVKIITLEVNVNNKEAISFYQKFGFEIISKRKKYYQDADGYLMGRKIQ